MCVLGGGVWGGEGERGAANLRASDLISQVAERNWKENKKAFFPQMLGLVVLGLRPLIRGSSLSYPTNNSYWAALMLFGPSPQSCGQQQRSFLHPHGSRALCSSPLPG